MFRLKLPDQKLFEELNAQIKKRVNYIYAKDLVLCCVTNIECKYHDKKAFIVSILNYCIKKNISKLLSLKEKVNFLVLINKVSNWKFEDLAYKSQLNLLLDSVTKGIVETQTKFIRSGGQIDSKKANSPEASSKESLTTEQISQPIQVLYMSNFYKVMIQAQKFESNLIDLIKLIINKRCEVLVADLLYFTAYTIQYSKAKKVDQSNLLSTLLVKLNSEFTKVIDEVY